jgi:hypothetical protein
LPYLFEKHAEFVLANLPGPVDVDQLEDLFCVITSGMA